MTEKTFTSMREFREHFFPNGYEEERKPEHILVILPCLGV